MDGSAISMDGGFGLGRRTRLSLGLQARLATADARAEWEAAAEERDAVAARADRRADEIASAFVPLITNGELSARSAAVYVDAVLAGRDVDLPPGVGFTRAEFVEHASALQDVEDARDAARQKAAYNAWLAGCSEDSSADASAPTPTEVAAAEHAATRVEAYRAQRRRDGRLLGRARVLAAMDAGRR